MTANELADVLENDDRLWFVNEDLMVKTCAMLRQQHSELKELKLARLADLDVILKQRAEIELLFKEIPEFEKVFSNEPVAYGKYLEEHDYWVTASGIIPNPKEGYVPLYTHPAKTLTDEEIEEVFRTVEQDFALTESKKSDGGWRNFPVELGRAILRKAQEK